MSFSYSDEDMQSLASLMSLKHSDIGNLDDFNDSDEEDKRTSTGTGKSVAATGREIPKPESDPFSDKPNFQMMAVFFIRKWNACFSQICAHAHAVIK